MVEVGETALRLALIVAALSAAAGVYAGATRRAAWTRVAERAVWLHFALVSVAMAGLFTALATFDFQLEYVARNSARSMPLHYRLAALWGGQAGSLLLWLWMLAAYAAACVHFNRRSNRGLMPWVVATLMANALFFLVLVNFVTSPFAKLGPEDVLSDGAGLNPLLQHPVMMIHPLILYTGFVGFVVPFSFAFAALATGQLGTTWFRTTRRWTLFAWAFLGIGILLGGRWAYEVLGWGGYWAWDPVENASFMPWLVATAYLHSVMIQEKRDMLKIWNLVLIGLTYSLCLFGTFLTRSGVVQSVHSFTNSGWFGFVFLAYVLAIAFAFFAVLVFRRRELRSTNRLESVVSREAGFLLNNWAFIALLAVVLSGTMYPVFSGLLTGSQTIVGPGWFNLWAGPLALFLMFLTGVGPLIAWRKASPANLRRQFAVPGIMFVVTAVALRLALGPALSFFSWMAFSLGAFVLTTVIQEYSRAVRARVRRGESPFQALATLLRKNQQRYGGYIVHVSVVCILIGVAGAGFNEQKLANVSVGQKIHMNGYTLEYLTARVIPEQHYGGAVARLALYEGDRALAVMTPEKRMYWLQEQPASIPSIYSTLGEDLYVILTALEPDGTATFKVYRNPLVNWIWIGGAIFVLGTVLLMWPHPRKRLEPDSG